MLGDGALGTMLQAAGLPLGVAPERWNLERPDAVMQVHAAHAAAGAQWVGTNSFGGSRSRLAASGLDSRTTEVNAAAVRCAREGAPGLPLLGSIGPTAAAEPHEWEREYAEQAEALAAAGVDGFIVETVIRLPEGVAAVRAAAATGAGPVIAAFTPGADGNLLDGASPEEAAVAFVQAGAAILGVNCGSGPASLLEPARRLVAVSLAPVLAAPSAGLPLITDGQAVYPVSPDSFARSAIQFQEAGVHFFAGCCGITPEHLRAAARALSRSTHTSPAPSVEGEV